MRPGAVVVLALTASACRPPATGSTLDAAQWTRRCTALLDEAREIMLPIAPDFARAKISRGLTSWYPGVRLEVRQPDGGVFLGGVARGRWPCAAGATPTTEPGPDQPWRNGPDARLVDLDRVHRVGGDTAWLRADRVPRAARARFQSVYQAAFAACLVEAQQVATRPPPPGYTCVGAGDREPAPRTAARRRLGAR